MMPFHGHRTLMGYPRTDSQSDTRAQGSSR